MTGLQAWNASRSAKALLPLRAPPVTRVREGTVHGIVVLSEAMELVFQEASHSSALTRAAFLVTGLEDEPDQTRQRRVSVRAPECHLTAVERQVVVAGGRLNGVMIGGVGLDDSATSQGSAPRPPGNLGQELKHMLAGPEVRQEQADVGQDYADERDAWKIQRLGDHLSTDQDVGLAGLERSPEPLMRPSSSRRVVVPASDSGTGETGPQVLLDALSAEAQKTDPRATAAGAAGRRGLAPAAPMAEQRIS